MSEANGPVEKALQNLKANWPEVATSQVAVTTLAHRLVKLMEERRRAILAEFGLSSAEFELLAALRTSPAPHQLIPSDLYDAILMSSGGLTKVLNSLQERALVYRPQSEGDKRSRPVGLTAEGKTISEQGMQAMMVANAPIFAALPAEMTLETFGAAVLALVEAAENGPMPED